jgi:hypothetical protein
MTFVDVLPSVSPVWAYMSVTGVVVDWMRNRLPV